MTRGNVTRTRGQSESSTAIGEVGERMRGSQAFPSFYHDAPAHAYASVDTRGAGPGPPCRGPEMPRAPRLHGPKPGVRCPREARPTESRKAPGAVAPSL